MLIAIWHEVNAVTDPSSKSKSELLVNGKRSVALCRAEDFGESMEIGTAPVDRTQLIIIR
jgi:hypothetical protein